MFNRSFISILIVTSAFTLVFGQTPEIRKDKETTPQIFSWSFNSDGGYLGIQTQEVTKENFSKFGLRDVRGVVVEKVVDGSPAQTAGLQNGDVILRINGDDITSTRKLTRLVSEISPDHTAKVTVLRGGSERDFNVTIGRRPAPKFGEGAFQFPQMDKMELPDMPELGKLPRVQIAPLSPDAPGEPMFFAFGNHRQIGVGLTPLTKQLSEHFGVDGGTMINSVSENSPAAKAGLKAGDIIVEVDGKAVKGDGDLVRAISEKKEGDVTLTIVRDRNRQTIRVMPEEMKGGFNTFFEFPDAPPSPGVFKMLRPLTPGTPPAAPMPLNQLFVPGRVV